MAVSTSSTTSEPHVNLRHDEIPISTARPTPRVLILQHVYPPKKSFWMNLRGKSEESLYKASILSHQTYARAWGHGYILDRTRWLGADDPRSKHLSKVYTLLHTVITELGREEQGAEWIMFADADTLILDPSISLSEFLPQPHNHPSPIILANVDHRGFNAGVMIFRVSLRLATFLMDMLANEIELFESIGIHPSDKHLFGYTLQQDKHKDVAEASVQIPQRWLNAYHIEGDGPALHVHLVNQRKWEEDWKRTIIGRADEVYEEARRQKLVISRGSSTRVGLRDALVQMNSWREARDVAREFWRDPKRGIGGIIFNEI
ncbi:hypothetical protein BD324DRAFT_681145 [Kockovaella imperatae]|uniref:Galactosyl transferase GMA12/MNN10 family-domain-containing protein n=1 Tax=Kockovaella imperatae TaxID=4999 RepID=A0A1Y1UGY3_9TREE|nr:hypothetical protein BD324DRAFT_681145 [Kockovaella imperatae]ORX37229.1 hypothetical protein BD324DRAFT_681145 [Kockovaella imperatae]